MTPDVLPRATEHIDEMVDLIETLLEKGHAYRTDDGSIFFRIASWPAYGRLARLDPSQLRVGERVEADDYGKDDVRDFALWKGPKPGEPSWRTPHRRGPAGLAHRVLGHEHEGTSAHRSTCTPAASTWSSRTTRTRSPSREAATGRPFVRTWLHCAHLQTGWPEDGQARGQHRTTRRGL